MTNDKPYLLLAACLLVAFFWFRDCARKEEPVTPVVPAEDKRKTEMLTDSLETAFEERERFLIDSLAKPIAERQETERIVYRYIRIKDEQLEQEYRNGQANADTVISSKNNRIKRSETLLARCDSLRGLDSLKIGSLAGTVSRKSLVADSLGLGWQQANIENAKLSKKVKRKNKLLKIGAGIIAALVGVVAIR